MSSSFIPMLAGESVYLPIQAATSQLFKAVVRRARGHVQHLAIPTTSYNTLHSSLFSYYFEQRQILESQLAEKTAPTDIRKIQYL